MSTEYSNEFNTLLGGEISAVETYDLAITKREFDIQTLESLNSCRASHADRVAKLTTLAAQTGGTPSTTSGVWGKFAALVQNSASSAHDAIAILEEFEAERLLQYETQKEIAPTIVKEVIVGDLLPAQHETHLILSSLLKASTPVPVN